MRISDWSSDVCSSDLVVAPRGEASVLVLEDGVRLEAAPPTANRDSPSDSGVLEFSRSQIPIDLAGREGFRPRAEHERELTLTELCQQSDPPPPGCSPAEMRAAFHDRLVRRLSVRSVEPRVWKECVSTWSFLWSSEH